MRDLANKMAELKFEAPLAQFEESDEWGPVEYQSSNGGGVGTAKVAAVSAISDTLNLNNLKESLRSVDGHHQQQQQHQQKDDDMNELNDNLLLGDDMVGSGGGVTTTHTTSNAHSNNNNNIKLGSIKDNIDFAEAFTGSLEDLVNTFDEKITKCFGNYEQSVEELAPVQVRSQDEIMNESQMWWTITGNFGNILPIDWSKTYARQLHVPALNLAMRKPGTPDDDLLQDLSSEDEAVASDLDMHALILNGLHADDPIKTADEVIKEIDDIMDETGSEDGQLENEVIEKAKEVLGSPLYEEKLRCLSITQLNELYMEMEVLIREFSETLISELALRDELEYEKELKNTFISLLLAVQNRRRQYHVEKKKGKAGGKASANIQNSSGMDPKYLTTVIPYQLNSTPDNQTLQVLIKILKAINEDSPTVPTLLTDYILKVLCPT